MATPTFQAGAAGTTAELRRATQQMEQRLVQQLNDELNDIREAILEATDLNDLKARIRERT